MASGTDELLAGVNALCEAGQKLQTLAQRQAGPVHVREMLVGLGEALAATARIGGVLRGLLEQKDWLEHSLGRETDPVERARLATAIADIDTALVRLAEARACIESAVSGLSVPPAPERSVDAESTSGLQF